MIRLTDGEIVFELNCSKGIVDTYDQNIIQVAKDVAQAQLKKVAEWLESPCRDHFDFPDKFVPRRRCGRCMEALLKERED